MPFNYAPSAGSTSTPQGLAREDVRPPSHWDLDQVLGGLYPDDRQRGAVVAELETLTYLHQSLVQQRTPADRIARLEQRIFQLLGVA